MFLIFAPLAINELPGSSKSERSLLQVWSDLQPFFPATSRWASEAEAFVRS
jgi:hypothetical protein